MQDLMVFAIGMSTI